MSLGNPVVVSQETWAQIQGNISYNNNSPVFSEQIGCEEFPKILSTSVLIRNEETGEEKNLSYELKGKKEHLRIGALASCRDSHIPAVLRKEIWSQALEAQLGTNEAFQAKCLAFENQLKLFTAFTVVDTARWNELQAEIKKNDNSTDFVSAFSCDEWDHLPMKLPDQFAIVKLKDSDKKVELHYCGPAVCPYWEAAAWWDALTNEDMPIELRYFVWDWCQPRILPYQF